MSIAQSCRMRVNWIRYVGGLRVRIAHKISAFEYNFQIDVAYASMTIRSTFHSDAHCAHIWITSSQGVFLFVFKFHLFQESDFFLTSWVNICVKVQIRIRWTACIVMSRIRQFLFGRHVAKLITKWWYRFYATIPQHRKHWKDVVWNVYFHAGPIRVH